MLCAWSMPEKVTPITWPSITTGPPELPGFSAASTCTRRPKVLR